MGMAPFKILMDRLPVQTQADDGADEGDALKLETQKDRKKDEQRRIQDPHMPKSVQVHGDLLTTERVNRLSS